MSGEWTMEISRNGMWPFKWEWKVIYSAGPPRYGVDLRLGCALTKERARRKMAAARVSIERDDVRFVETSCA